MNLKKLGGAVALAALCAAMPAGAAVFKPTGATASSEFNADYRAIYTIDGSGLSSLLDVSSAHADYDQDNHWTTSGSSPLTQYITWTFSAPQTVGAIYIWNHRSNVIAANSGYEPILFDLTFRDAGDNILLALDNVKLLADNAYAQRFDIALLSNVSSVRFDVEATQSSTSYTGLAEVAFDDVSRVAVPEASTWAMMIGGLGLVGAALRRKRAVLKAA